MQRSSGERCAGRWSAAIRLVAERSGAATAWLTSGVLITAATVTLLVRAGDR
jgi:hypothetical protein